MLSNAKQWMETLSSRLSFNYSGEFSTFGPSCGQQISSFFTIFFLFGREEIHFWLHRWLSVDMNVSLMTLYVLHHFLSWRKLATFSQNFAILIQIFMNTWEPHESSHRVTLEIQVFVLKKTPNNTVTPQSSIECIVDFQGEYRLALWHLNIIRHLFWRETNI